MPSGLSAPQYQGSVPLPSHLP